MSSTLLVTSNRKTATGVETTLTPQDATYLLTRTSRGPQGPFNVGLTGTAGEALSENDICQLNGSGLWVKADQSAEATAKGFLAMATESIANAASGSFLTKGTHPGTGLTAGAQYFLSTSGGKVPTAPGTGIVRAVGYATSATEFFFNPDHSYFE